MTNTPLENDNSATQKLITCLLCGTKVKSPCQTKVESDYCGYWAVAQQRSTLNGGKQ